MRRLAGGRGVGVGRARSVRDLGEVEAPGVKEPAEQREEQDERPEELLEERRLSDAA